MGTLYRAIVVGTDGSATAKQAIERAGALAEAAGATLHIAMAAPTMSIVAPPDLAVAVTSFDESGSELARGVLEDAAAGLADRLLDVEVHVRGGDPATALLTLSEEIDADLLVVGSKGMQGAKRFLLGSVSSRCAHHAGCDVLIVYTG